MRRLSTAGRPWRVTRRRVLGAGAIALAAPQQSLALLLRGGGGGGGGGGSTQLAALSMTNPGASTQAAGPMRHFYHLFKEGDIPAGTAPKLPYPYSVGLQTYWPDGSWKGATLMPLVTAPVAAGASLSGYVDNGGTPLATSGRTLAELYSQGLKVTIPLMSGQPRSGTLYAWVNGDSNQFEAVKWLDGPAGTGWRISMMAAATQGGTPDGMIVVTLYVIALNNTSGGLAGYRVRGFLRQPFYNQTGQTNNAPGAFVWIQPSCSITLGGQTQQIPWTGTDGNPIASYNFTTPASGQACTVTGGGTHNLAFRAGGWNVYPIAYSGFPGGYNNTTAGWGALGPSGFAFLVVDAANPTTQAEIQAWGTPGNFAFSFAAAYNISVTPCLCLQPLQRVPLANSNADYFYFQGTGSIAADSVLHPVVDRSYFPATKVIPPYNTAQIASVPNGGTITPLAYSNGSTPIVWYAYATGFNNLAQAGVGDHPDIGILPQNYGNHLVCQTPDTLRYQRISAYSWCSTAADLLDFPAKQRLNLGNPGTNYGLAAPASQTMSYQANYPQNNSGFPNPNSTPIGYQYSLGEHEPTYTVCAVLTDGGLDMFDLMVDQAFQSMSSQGTNGATGSGTNRIGNSGSAGISTTLYGLVGLGNVEMRSYVWSMRNLVWAAALFPYDASGKNTVWSDGSNLGQFLVDCRAANIKWPLLQLQQVTTNSYLQALGIWYPYFPYEPIDSGPGWGANCPVYQLDMMMSLYALAYAHGDANASSFITTSLLPERNKMVNVLGGYLSYGDLQRPWALGLDSQGTNGYVTAGNWITADAQIAMGSNISDPNDQGGTAAGYITWGTTSPAFLLNVTNTSTIGPAGQVRPQNGDQIMAAGPYNPGDSFGYNELVPAGFTQYSIYNIVNLAYSGSNIAFDLSPTPGGSALLPTSASGAGIAMGNRWRPTYKSPVGCSSGDAYIAQAAFWERWLVSLGVTVTLQSDLENRLANSNNPLGVYPNQTTDLRYGVAA